MEDEIKEDASLKEQVTRLRIAMATLKTELSQFKYVFAVLSIANITLSIVVNVQV